MPKRLTVTGKWNELWFMKLTPQAKLIFLYILDNCDFTGIYEYNEELLRVQIGFGDKVDVRRHINELEGKVELFNGGKKIWVVNFIKVQYGVLNDKSSIHKAVLVQLKKYYGDPQIGVRLTCHLKALNQLFRNVRTENDVGYRVQYTHPNGNGNGKKQFKKGLLGEKLFSPPTKQQVHEVMAKRSDASVDAEYESGQFIFFYQSNGWLVGQNPMDDWQASAMKWIDDKMHDEKKKIKKPDGIPQKSNLKTDVELLKKYT